MCRWRFFGIYVQISFLCLFLHICVSALSLSLLNGTHRRTDLWWLPAWKLSTQSELKAPWWESNTGCSNCNPHGTTVFFIELIKRTPTYYPCLMKTFMCFCCAYPCMATCSKRHGPSAGPQITNTTSFSV